VIVSIFAASSRTRSRSSTHPSAAKHQTISLSAPDSEAWANVDAGRTREVFTNLLSKESKFSAEGSAISITISFEESSEPTSKTKAVESKPTLCLTSSRCFDSQLMEKATGSGSDSRLSVDWSSAMVEPRQPNREGAAETSQAAEKVTFMLPYVRATRYCHSAR